MSFGTMVTILFTWYFQSMGVSLGVLPTALIAIPFAIIFMIFYMPGISYINPYFRAPSPPKPLKSRPQGQNLPGFPLIAHSDHRGPVSAQFCGLSCLFLTLS